MSILGTHCTVLYDLNVLLCVFTAPEWTKNWCNSFNTAFACVQSPCAVFMWHCESTYTGVSAVPHAIKGNQQKHIHATMWSMVLSFCHAHFIVLVMVQIMQHTGQGHPIPWYFIVTVQKGKNKYHPFITYLNSLFREFKAQLWFPLVVNKHFITFQVSELEGQLSPRPPSGSVLVHKAYTHTLVTTPW